MSKPKYRIVESDDERGVVLEDGSYIPADIAGLCVGRDLWLSQIECKCRDCGELFPLSQLAGGGQWCEECQNASIEEDE
jgi:hypothetical protein